MSAEPLPAPRPPADDLVAPRRPVPAGRALLLAQTALLVVLPQGGQRTARRNALAGIEMHSAARRRPETAV